MTANFSVFPIRIFFSREAAPHVWKMRENGFNVERGEED